MSRETHWRGGSDRGSVIYEFALVFPLFVLLAIVSFDFAHYYHTDQRVAILGREVGSAVINRCIFPASDVKECLKRIEPDLVSLARDILPEVAERSVLHITARPFAPSVGETSRDITFEISFMSSSEDPTKFASRRSEPKVQDLLQGISATYPTPVMVEILLQYTPPVALSSLYDFTRESVIYKVSVH